MSQNQTETVSEYCHEYHSELLRASTLPHKHFRALHIIAALVLPPLALVALQQRDSGILLVPSPPAFSQTEEFRAAAPEGYVDDEKDIDDTEVLEFLCTEVCVNDYRNDTEFLRTFCSEACGIPAELLPLNEVQIESAIPQTETQEYSISPQEPTATETTEKTYEKFKVQTNQRYTGSRKPHNHRGVYLNTSGIKSDSVRESAATKLKESNGNALVFDVKGSSVYFESDAQLASEMGLVRPVYDLPAIVQEAKNNGLYTIARFIVAKDPSLASRKPETQIQNKFTGKGIGDVWVNPSHETVLRYNQEVLRDVIASGVDEVNFDYIRFPTEYAQKSIGLTGDEKADRIEAFLLMARSTVNEMGTDTKLGISTYAILGWNFPVNFEPLGQDIARFAPLVDVISPMAYPSTFAVGSYYNPAKHPGSRMYYLVYRTLQGYKELLGDDYWKLRPWIQGYYVSSKNVSDEAKAVFDSGLCGFTMWNAQNSHAEAYKAMKTMEVPTECL